MGILMPNWIHFFIPLFIGIILSVFFLLIFKKKKSNSLFKLSLTSKNGLKLGKYYNPSIDYKSILQQKKEIQELNELKLKWEELLYRYKEDIERLEEQVDKTSDTNKILEFQALLQPLYEKRHVGELFLPRFNSINNLSLLRELYNNGIFLQLEIAEQKVKEYDRKLYFQTSNYQKKRNICAVIKCVVCVLSLPLFWYFLGSCVAFIYCEVCHKVYKWVTLGEKLGYGLYVFCGGLAITLPVWTFIGMGLLPALVDKLIMGDKISSEDKKQRTISRTAAMTSGVVTGAIMGNENKKVNEKYKVKE